MDMEQTAIQELRERLTALVMGLASKTRSMSLVAFREQSANPAEDMGQGNARVPPGGSVAATPEPQSKLQLWQIHMSRRMDIGSDANCRKVQCSKGQGLDDGTHSIGWTTATH